MNDFIARYQDQLSGTLSGFDRLVFRGTLWRDQITGMKGYLWAHGLGAKDFGAHAEHISKQMKEASLAPVLTAGRPVHYLNSGKEDKQQIALRHCRRRWHCCRPDLRTHSSRTVPQLCHPPQPQDAAAGIEHRTPQVSVPLSLLDASGVRFHEYPVAKLVSVPGSPLPQ